VDAGVGGAMLNAGQAVLGAHGMAGEFGHMPFGEPGLRCACGAMGCWNTSLNGYAVARLLGDPPPPDEVGYLRGVLAAGRAGQPGALGALGQVARSLGRGTAPLVPARLGDEAPLIGAAEEAFSLALSDEGLKSWTSHDHGED